jgi:peptide/nickel transport system ATP-binding protein
MSAPLFEAIDLVKSFKLPRRSLFAPNEEFRAVDGVSFTIEAGRSLGIVGESGSGKSTLARLAIAVETPTSGEARLLGEALNSQSAAGLRALRAHMQMVFQDPYGSLDPRQTIVRIVAEPLSCLAGVSREMRDARVTQALEEVGLGAEDARKYPHEFSGGQRQRIAIARALITGAKLIIADEPVSALDISIQAQVLNLMMDLRTKKGVSYLFISHDLAVVEHVCDDVAVMYRGRFVEMGAAAAVFAAPAHPYTRALRDSAPRLLGERAKSPPHAVNFASVKRGCVYAPRCPLAAEICREQAPAMRQLSDGRAAACHFPQ